MHTPFTSILGLFYILLVAPHLLIHTLHLLHAPHTLLMHPHVFVFHFYPSFPPFQNFLKTQKSLKIIKNLLK